MQMFFNGAHVLPPWTKLSTERPLSYLIRRSTLERICQKLLLESSSNVRIVDGIVRQAQISKDTVKNVESVQVRQSDSRTITIQDPALVIGTLLPTQ